MAKFLMQKSVKLEKYLNADTASAANCSLHCTVGVIPANNRVSTYLIRATIVGNIGKTSVLT